MNMKGIVWCISKTFVPRLPFVTKIKNFVAEVDMKKSFEQKHNDDKLISTEHA